MQIKLNTIKLENFKGLKSFEFSPDGRDASIRAENGVGKTTVYDAWLWLLFGKDSDGKTDFSIRPLDDNNKPIKGLIVAVEINVNINGDVHVLRKEQHEKVVKKQLKGYEAVCSINEVSKKVGEFQEFIENLCPEELFRQLTDLDYFNGKMHWIARRKVLVDLAGKIPKPAGFESLQENLNGRKLEDYENILKDRKKAYSDEREQINPRIDELQRGLDSYVQNADEGKLEDQRNGVQKTIDALNKQRDELLTAEKERQKTINKINHLTCERLHRESQLSNDTSGQKKLLDEKTKLDRGLIERQNELSIAKSKIKLAQTNKENIEAQIQPKMKGLENVRDSYKSIQDEKTGDEKCFNCGQPLPEKMRQQSQKERLANLTELGNNYKHQINVFKQQKKEVETEIIALHAEWEKANKEFEEAKTATADRIAKINEALKNRPKVDPATDKQWLKLTIEIKNLQVSLGAPVAEQLDVIETNVKAAQEKLNDINKTLVQADNIKKARKRIVELENREKELAQLIADCEKELDQIAQYKLQESRMVEAAVNDRFQYIEFKLFEYFLNGEIKETCVAVLNGVPYPDMSSGQKILAGIDVVNTLGDHYGVTVPLFIDHAESITYPIEADAQTILLRAVPGVKALQVVAAQEAGKAVV